MTRKWGSWAHWGCSRVPQWTPSSRPCAYCSDRVVAAAHRGAMPSPRSPVRALSRPRDSVYGLAARRLLVGRVVVGACSNDGDHLFMASPFVRLSSLVKRSSPLDPTAAHMEADMHLPATTAGELARIAGVADFPTRLLPDLGVLLGNDRHHSMCVGCGLLAHARVHRRVRCSQCYVAVCLPAQAVAAAG